MQKITVEQFQDLAEQVRHNLLQRDGVTRPVRIWGVPRGGIPAAAAIANGVSIIMVDTPENADVIVDDLIDSGSTMDKFTALYPHKPFVGLIDKRTWEHGNDWVVWPWEETAEKGIEDHIRRLLEYVGDDPNRGGLLETPARVAKAWKEWCEGYGTDPADVLKMFEDGAEGCDEMVVVKDLPFYSKCEHHLADIIGTATIAYVPNGKIVGLSKLDRLLDVYARRLQVQERLTAQIADALMEHLGARGAGVVIKARHMCMESRGVRKQGHHTITSALRGVFKDQPSTRAEFLLLANS